jgi:sensor histidine kinase regulating citrate/malate metabolism
MSRVVDTLELSVTDNGPGFSPAVRSSMFDEGFTTKVTGAHAGIGLSLVRESVATLGGTIHVAREEGAVFSVSVPNAFDSTRSVVS